MRKLRVAAVLALLLGVPASGCGGTKHMKPFDKPQMGAAEIEPVVEPFALSRPLRVTVLYFDDKRENKLPSVDDVWTIQGKEQVRAVAPEEARGMFQRGLVSGLRRMSDLTIVPASAIRGPDATDVIISGTIVRCDVAASSRGYKGRAEMQVMIRSGDGVPLLKEPINIAGSYHHGLNVDGKQFGFTGAMSRQLSPAVEKTIENTLAEFLQARAVRHAFERGTGG